MQASILDRDQLFIGGQWVTPATDARIEVTSPHTEDRLATVVAPPPLTSTAPSLPLGPRSTTARGPGFIRLSGSRPCAGWPSSTATPAGISPS